MKNSHRCGYVAIIGRPNVGKSTLLNHLLGKKLSITSCKPQTTQHRILGIKTENNVQALYVDTPGIHKKAKRAVNRSMNRAATTAIFDVDVIVFMIDSRYWTAEDELVLSKIKNAKAQVILVLNKVDLFKNKKRLLPTMNDLSKKMQFKEVVPLSVIKEVNVSKLEKLVNQLLPENEYLFPDDQLTDRSDNFLISEIVREKIVRVTGEEIPYETTVMVESVERKKEILHVDVVIWVERRGQKIIIIGNKGEKLKEIGKQARIDIEKLFSCKVFLSLWVKVKEGWSNDEKTLLRLGFN